MRLKLFCKRFTWRDSGKLRNLNFSIGCPVNGSALHLYFYGTIFVAKEKKKNPVPQRQSRQPTTGHRTRGIWVPDCNKNVSITEPHPNFAMDMLIHSIQFPPPKKKNDQARYCYILIMLHPTAPKTCSQTDKSKLRSREI